MSDDPFVTVLCGGSQRTGTEAALRSMSGTTAPTNTATGESGDYFAALARKSSSEQEPAMLALFGECLETKVAKKGRIVQYSGMKVRTFRPSLSDKLTQSLITSGLVCGTTPLFVRQQCGAQIPDTVFSRQDGANAA